MLKKKLRAARKGPKSPPDSLDDYVEIALINDPSYFGPRHAPPHGDSEFKDVQREVQDTGESVLSAKPYKYPASFLEISCLPHSSSAPNIAPVPLPGPKFIAPLNTEFTDSPDREGSLHVGISTMRPIKYTYGNKVLTNDINLYMIYYGATWTDTQRSIINEFANNIGASDWYKTTKLYYYQSSPDANKVYVNGAVKVAATVNDAGSLGNTLSGSNLPDLIQNLTSAGTLPEDEEGVYFVFTTDEIVESIRPDPKLGASNFCMDYCGYHVTTKLKSGKRIQYSMVGNPISQCPRSCGPTSNQNYSPNGDPGVDALLSTFAHELTEAVTDPISDSLPLRAWQDVGGDENADKCAWRFGNVTRDAAAGYTYNVQIGGKNYLIQQNWDPNAQTCV